jgi:hypothetical protein
MARVSEITDSQVLIRVYRALQDSAGPHDEGDIEMAVLDDWIEDFGRALEYAETDEQALRAEEAIEAAQALRRAMMALVAAPGAASDESAA